MLQQSAVERRRECLLISVRESAHFLIFTHASAIPTTEWSYSCAKKPSVCGIMLTWSLKAESWAIACGLVSTICSVNKG